MKNSWLVLSLFSISIIFSQDCELGYTEVNDLCFHEGDLNVLQKFIDNSYATGFTEANCEQDDPYCGSPNPYMDSEDAWFWVVVDSVHYQSGTSDGFQNVNGVVEPLELGLQEWNNGRLTSLMCGAYIYCQLSGPIPEDVVALDEISVLRLEYNYLSGFIPEEVCDLAVDHVDYLDFDLVGNYLCPPYPDCIGTGGFWSQDTSSCTNLGDTNFDADINVLDVIRLVNFVLGDDYPDNQEFIASDFNQDGSLDVLDIIEIVDTIIQID